MQTKRCTCCTSEKPLESFRFKSGGKHLKHSICKPCETLKQRERREKEKSESYELYSLKIQDRMLRQNYKITLDDYNVMWEKQQGVCKICKKTCTKNLAVDHCHQTGKIRGLLCQKCNRGLGFFNDSKELLAEAIMYLERNEDGNSES